MFQFLIAAAGNMYIRVLRKENSHISIKMLQYLCQHLHKSSHTCSNIRENINKEHVYNKG